MRGHFVKIKRSEFEALWNDRSKRVVDIAEHFGMCLRATTARAKSYGLELRGLKTKKPKIADSELFREMYEAGVGSEDLAAHFDVTYRTIANTAKRLDLPPRLRGKRPKVGLREFLTAKELGREAADIRAEWWLAEMVDRKAPHANRKQPSTEGAHAA